MADKPKSVAEIKAELAKLELQLKEQTDTRLEQIQKDLAELAEDAGKSIDDLLGYTARQKAAIDDAVAVARMQWEAERPKSKRAPNGSVPAKTPKNAAKYKNPANHSETWSGTGRKPGWYEQHEKAGKAIADLEMTDDEVAAWKVANKWQEPPAA